MELTNNYQDQQFVDFLFGYLDMDTGHKLHSTSCMTTGHRSPYAKKHKSL